MIFVWAILLLVFDTLIVGSLYVSATQHRALNWDAIVPLLVAVTVLKFGTMGYLLVLSDRLSKTRQALINNSSALLRVIIKIRAAKPIAGQYFIVVADQEYTRLDNAFWNSYCKLPFGSKIQINQKAGLSVAPAVKELAHD